MWEWISGQHERFFFLMNLVLTLCRCYLLIKVQCTFLRKCESVTTFTTYLCSTRYVLIPTQKSTKTTMRFQAE